MPAPFLLALALLLVLAAVYVGYALARSLPAPKLTVASVHASFPGRAPRLAWPHQGEAAVTVEGVGSLGTSGAQRPTPIASVAKIMTAYLVLSDHPLAAGQSGPVLTITPRDATVEHIDAAQGQSVLPVRAGEKLTELQALEGLLLPSGNNIAHLLAGWDAGSEAAFVRRMNARARALGLSGTHYVGASGLNPATVSTAADQVHLATLAFRIPSFRAIVGMAQANFPVAGRQYNVDALLGRDGIVGIKTGSTLQAGGCFVFATRERVGGRKLTVIGAIFGQQPTRAVPSLLGAVFRATPPLVRSARRAPRTGTVLRSGTRLATVTAPWSPAVPLVAARPARFIGWGGLPVHVALTGTNRIPAQIHAGERIGSAIVTVGPRRTIVPIVAQRSLRSASLSWRLQHP